MAVLRWGTATAVGPVRAANEDSLLAGRPVFVVADGMGGHAAGQDASRIAVEVFGRFTGERVTGTEPVLAAVGQANAAILAAAAGDGSRTGMGTTVVGLALVEESGVERWLAFNVGDSRIYRLEQGVLEQLSVDHSVVQELIDAGVVTEAERGSHPRSHMVTRVLGTEPAPVADSWLLTPVPGERFLLCSDGLTGDLSDERLESLLGVAEEPGEVARLLVAAALTAGARDNVTVVVVEVLDETHPA